MDYSLKFTKEDANELASLLDLAVKAGGLAVAKQVVGWITRLEAAVQEGERSPAVPTSDLRPPTSSPKES